MQLVTCNMCRGTCSPTYPIMKQVVPARADVAQQTYVVTHPEIYYTLCSRFAAPWLRYLATKYSCKIVRCSIENLIRV